MKQLKIILQVLREKELFFKFSKCDFFKNRIQYLGHVVSKNEISLDPDKIKVIIECFVPKNMLGLGTLAKNSCRILPKYGEEHNGEEEDVLAK